ncbi:MAG TPA: Ig-like domain-containing protein [Anaerolineales bacterium]|nr:Ig-like domain-containing protein [Anaerolineales bacterium]
MQPPTLLSPAKNNYVTNVARPTFTWTEVANAEQYEIVFAKDSHFTQNVDPHFVSDATLTVSNPLPDGKYYWRARAYNAANQYSGWSTWRSFSIDTSLPLAPVLKSPANNASLRGVPTFRWSNVSGAVSYQFEIDNDSDFSSPVFSISQRTSYRRPPGALRGSYFWRVRAQDAAGNWSAWSEVFVVNILRAR